MPDLPDIPDVDWNRIPLGPFDSRLWWLLIGIALALLFTIQAIETAVEGAWPNQRRPGNYLPRARTVQKSWSIVALLIVPGALLSLGIVSVLIWKDPPRPTELTLGAWLFAIGWALFLLFSLDMLKLGMLMGNLGIAGPIMLIVLLLVADVLLFVAFRDMVPEWTSIREAAEGQLKDWLPFYD